MEWPMEHLSDLFGEMMQIAYVTNDIDAATSYLETTLGIARFRINRGSSLGGRIHVGGELVDEWVIDAALAYSGATNIEVIRPVSGAVALYRSGIRHGALLTLHHLGFRVDDFDAATRVVERAGRAWAQNGTFGDIRFGYLDFTAELGHYVEVMELGPQAAAFFASIAAESRQTGQADRPAPGTPA
jgi:hypothetical protein